MYTEDPELKIEEGHAELNQEAWVLRGTSGRRAILTAPCFTRSVNRSIYRGFVITLQGHWGQDARLIIITGIALINKLSYRTKMSLTAQTTGYLIY